jgi:hypothetical protein
MTQSKFASLIFIGAMISMAAQVHSQHPSDPAKNPAPAAPSAEAAAPPGPSAETIKRANAVGLRSEVRKGVTVYCWEDADTGTRFKTKKCVNENQLEDMVQRLEAQRAQKRRGF